MVTSVVTTDISRKYVTFSLIFPLRPAHPQSRKSSRSRWCYLAFLVGTLRSRLLCLNVTSIHEAAYVRYIMVRPTHQESTSLSRTRWRWWAFLVCTFPSRLLYPRQSYFTSVPAGSSSRGGDVTVYVCDIKQPSLPTPFYSALVSISVFLAPFNCISFQVLPTILRFLTLFFRSYLCLTGPFNYMSLYEGLL